ASGFASAITRSTARSAARAPIPPATATASQSPTRPAQRFSPRRSHPRTSGFSSPAIAAIIAIFFIPVARTPVARTPSPETIQSPTAARHPPAARETQAPAPPSPTKQTSCSFPSEPLPPSLSARVPAASLSPLHQNMQTPLPRHAEPSSSATSARSSPPSGPESASASNSLHPECTARPRAPAPEPHHAPEPLRAHPPGSAPYPYTPETSGSKNPPQSGPSESASARAPQSASSDSES